MAGLLLSTMVAVCCFYVGTAVAGAVASEDPVRTTQSTTLPTGEIVTNEVTVYPDFLDGHITQQLYYRANAASPPEPLGKLGVGNLVAINMEKTETHVLRKGDRVALVVGDYVFKHVNRPSGQNWLQVDLRPTSDPTAARFLATFLKSGESPGRIERERYELIRVDLDADILVVGRRSNSGAFPQFLIYGAATPDSPWEFDLAQTRAANHLPPPEGISP